MLNRGQPLAAGETLLGTVAVVARTTTLTPSLILQQLPTLRPAGQAGGVHFHHARSGALGCVTHGPHLPLPSQVPAQVGTRLCRP